MSGIAIIGALLMIALMNVLAGMLPGNITGDVQLAVWLVSLLVGVFTYTALQLTGDEFRSGYHTAQLYNAFTQSLADHDLVIVLDDIEFLLLNDGSDLLYFLSRLDPQYAPRLVMVSATHQKLSTVLDERIYSSLRPATILLDPYTETKTIRILKARVPDWVNQDVTIDALAAIAATSQSIRLCRDWITTAAEITDGRIREEIIHLTRTDAQHRYRTNRLATFSDHHRLLMQSIEQLASETGLIHSGAVYEWYRKSVHSTGEPA